MTRMTSSERKTGVQGATVAANVKRLMEEQNLNSGSLARKIAEIDQPTELADGTAVKPAKLADLAIRRIVAGERKVDVDDLVLLAYALGVAPVTLMQEPAPTAGSMVLTPIGPMNAGIVWAWITGRTRWGKWPEKDASSSDPRYVLGHRLYLARANPPWTEEANAAWEQSSLSFDED